MHWAGCCPRFMEHEFKPRRTTTVWTASRADWPISLADLEPYYERAEAKLGLTGTNGIPTARQQQLQGVRQRSPARRLQALHTGRYACNPVPRDGRPATIQDGFPFQGSKNRSRWSTLYTEIPRALATGKLDLRPECHVIRVEADEQGLATGVTYVDGDGLEQFQRARIVAVAGNAIETPRLLLHLATGGCSPMVWPTHQGQLGCNYMRHLTASVFAIFDQPVRMYRGETMAGHIEDEAPHNASRGLVGGYYLQLLSLGVPFLAAFMNPGGWGPRLRGGDGGLREHGGPVARRRGHAAADQPRDAQPRRARPVRPAHTNVHFDDHLNDIAMREHAWAAGAALYASVGAVRTIRTPPYPATHNIGTARMSERPRTAS